MRHYHDDNRPTTPCPEFEAFGLAIRPFIPLSDTTAVEHLPDWPRGERPTIEGGSVVLQWLVAAVLLGFVGLCMLTPTGGGAPHEVAAQHTD